MSTTWRTSLSALLPALLACATSPAREAPAPTPAPRTLAPQRPAPGPVPAPRLDASLAPRALFFGNPDRSNPRISPDGTWLAYLAPLDNVMNVWVAPRDNLDKARAVTQDKLRGVRVYEWAHDGTHLLYLQDQGGDENWHLYAVDVAKGLTRDLTPLDGVRAELVKVSHLAKGQVVVALNDRDRRFNDLHLVELKSGRRRLLQTNEHGFLGFAVDDDYRPRLAFQALPTGGLALLRKKGPAWEPLLQLAPEDAMQSGPLELDRSGDTLYLLDSTGRDTAALFALDLTTGQRTLLVEPARADIDRAMIHPTRKTIEAVATSYERRSWQFLDAAIGQHFAELATLGDGDLEVSSRSLDDRWWTVTRVVDDGPVRYYLYDTRSRTARLLFSARPELEGRTLARMHPRVLPARDGLQLVSYLSLPPASDPDGDGVPEAPLPTVLLVHGGPWGRDEWGYNGWHQWLASRGYAVLSVNFRGSVGFGKAFTNAADGQWAGTMHDDLLDAVAWAVAQRISLPDRVAIMGGSYGGYATLVGLTFTPEAFTCGVDIVGPSNLVTLLENVPPYWVPMLPLLTTRVGDPGSAQGRARLEAASPLFKADRIVRPLLIGQGANDPRVKQAESDQIVRAMQQRGIPVTYALFPDEGHGFARPPNRLAFNAVAELFLSQCLGGLAQPPGADLDGSTLQVPAGVDGVHGLAEALRASAARGQAPASLPASTPAP